MKNLTKTAKDKLDGYLSEVRRYLGACKTVDGDEIIRDVTGHIELELETAVEPVSYDVVGEILTRLGSPQQWVPEEDMSWWRKILLQLQHGPDDWRLAYISFGVFVLAILLLPLSVVLLPLSFFLSRAALSLVEEADELGNRKFLLYPPLVVVYSIFAVLLLAGPSFVVMGIADAFEHDISRKHEYFRDDLDYWWWAWVIVFLISGIWWNILSVVSLAFNKFFELIFKPFLKQSSRKKIALTLSLTGLFLILVAVGLGWAFGAAGGPSGLLDLLHLQ